MLTIRSEQLEVFQSALRERLETRVLAHLRTRFPERCAAIEESRLRSLATRQIEAARRYGVTTIESIAFLCGWFLELGDDLARSPAGDEALAILRDPTYPGQIKVLLVGECLEACSRGRTLVGA